MEPLAASFAVNAATAGLLATIIGAMGGAIVWRGQFRLIPGIACACVVYVLLSVPLSAFLIAIVHGIPLLTLTLLVAWLTAHHLRHRAQLRVVSAVCTALAAALLVGLLHVFLLRLSLWFPAFTA